MTSSVKSRVRMFEEMASTTTTQSTSTARSTKGKINCTKKMKQNDHLHSSDKLSTYSCRPLNNNKNTTTLTTTTTTTTKENSCPFVHVSKISLQQHSSTKLDDITNTKRRMLDKKEQPPKSYIPRKNHDSFNPVSRRNNGTTVMARTNTKKKNKELEEQKQYQPIPHPSLPTNNSSKIPDRQRHTGTTTKTELITTNRHHYDINKLQQHHDDLIRTKLHDFSTNSYRNTTITTMQALSPTTPKDTTNTATTALDSSSCRNHQENKSLLMDDTITADSFFLVETPSSPVETNHHNSSIMFDDDDSLDYDHDTKDGSFEILPTQPKSDIRPPPTKHTKESTQKRKKRQAFKRFWEFTYGLLAILELLSCSQLPSSIVQLYQLRSSTSSVVMSSSSSSSSWNIPEYASPLLSYTSSIRSSTTTTASLNPKVAFYHKSVVKNTGHVEVDGYNGKTSQHATKGSCMAFLWNQISTSYEQLYQFFFPDNSFQDVINVLFVIAVAIHLSIESWTWASTKTKKKHQEAEEKAMRVSARVTSRSKRRYQTLETTSSNRHFIMRWSRNTIKWSKTTSEITRGTIVLIIAAIPIVPFMRRNPFEKETRKALEMMFPQTFLLQQKKTVAFFSSIRKDSISSVSTLSSSSSEAMNVTYSLFEIVFLRVSEWCASATVIRFRKSCKKLLLKTIKLILLRPSRINKIFTGIRWAKFLAPLIGKCNKFRGHWIDLREKARQRLRRKRAKASWQKVCDDIHKKQKIDKMVRVLQKRYRAKKKAKVNIGKANVTETRYIFEQVTLPKRRKLRLSGIGTAKVFAQQVRKEMRDKVRKNRKLLLRPDTNFAVIWKMVTVWCVFIEVATHLVSNPQIGSISCIQLLFAPSVTCMVRVVSFIDVPVTFFTGDIDGTGLKPKGFFKRWILPGVGLQLIVNPSLLPVSRALATLWKWAASVGRMRILHVLLALQPVVRSILNGILSCLYLFVDAWNSSRAKRKDSKHWKQL